MDKVRCPWCGMSMDERHAKMCAEAEEFLAKPFWWWVFCTNAGLNTNILENWSNAKRAVRFRKYGRCAVLVLMCVIGMLAWCSFYATYPISKPFMCWYIRRFIRKELPGYRAYHTPYVDDREFRFRAKGE